MILAALLLLELLYVLFVAPSGAAISGTTVGPKAVGISLFGPYLLVVELASMLLLARPSPPSTWAATRRRSKSWVLSLSSMVWRSPASCSA